MTETIEIKQQVKEALHEFFIDDNNMIRNIISDVIEDIALGKAIESGDIGDYVDENVIISMLSKEN